MPRDLLTSFLKQYLTTDNTFQSRPIKAIAFKPSEISDAEQQQLIQKLNDSSLVDSNVSRQNVPDDVATLNELIQKKWILTVHHPHISSSIVTLRQSRKLVSYINELIHRGEEDISDLYWVYLSGTEAEKTAIQDMLKMLPLEFPFVKFVRQMLT